jgi:hypothetical protein
MKSSVKFALFFAFSAIILRLIAFFGGYINSQTGQYVIFMHLLFVLLSVFFAIRNIAPGNGTDRERLMDELKTGAKAGGLYAVISTAFVFIYFKLIDTTYFPAKREQLIAAQLKAGAPDAEKVRQNVEGFFSIGNYTAVTLIGLVVVGLIYTLVLVVVNRYIIERMK